MKEIIICVSPSGCGKSTYANHLVKTNNNFLKINRDDIRKTLVGNMDGYYTREDFNELEGLVNQLELNFATRLVISGKSIVIDNTHLVQKYITRWTNLFETDNFFNHREYKIKFKLFECDLMVAKNRVWERDYLKTPEDFLGQDYNDTLDEPQLLYIDKQFKQYQEVKKWLLENYKDDII